MSTEFLARRAWIVQAVKANPATVITDRGLRARLEDPDSDCSFDELALDSLARMELCIWLQLNCGVEIGESEVLEHAGVNALATYLAGR